MTEAAGDVPASRLDEHLRRLLDWLALPADTSPVLLVEEADVRRSGDEMEVARGALWTAETYAARFDALLGAGFAWINLGVLGRLGDALLVAVEVPREGVGCPPDRVAVNLSGPAAAVERAGWDLSRWVTVREDRADGPAGW